MTPGHIRAHRHSTHHREEVVASESCGCFCCGSVFHPDGIEQWTDDWESVGQTAICPDCGIDAVIGSESGYPITPEFLDRMRQQWF
jgi:hypothetical protein